MNRWKMFFLLMGMSILMTTPFLTGCNLGQTEIGSEDQALEDDVNAQAKAINQQDQQLGEWYCYKEYDKKGDWFTIKMFQKTDKTNYLTTYDKYGNQFYIDLMNIDSNRDWAGKIKSISQARWTSDYPEIYISKNPGMEGAHGSVEKLVAQSNNVPFRIVSVMPVVPAYYQTKYVDIQMLANFGQKPVAWKVNGSDFPVIPNGFGDWNQPETQFTFSYVDVNNKFFYLKSKLNGYYVCADLNLGGQAPLHANRVVASYWELFKIYSLRKDPSNREWIKFRSAGATGRSLASASTSDPIACYGYDEEFMLYRF